MDLLRSKSRLKKRLLLSEELKSDGINLNDKTKPALKPDAKIRRMTEGNVDILERPFAKHSHRRKIFRKDQKAPDG